MKHNINIVGNNRAFKYIVEYNKGDIVSNDYDIKWYKNDNIIHLHTNEIKYQRDVNDWYHVDVIQNDKDHPEYKYTNEHTPSNNVVLTKVRIYLPIHSLSTYVRDVKYMLTLNTWIGRYKIDLGSFLFKPTDAAAIPTGTVSVGNIEYYEFIEFTIIDPYYLIYGANWDDFRKTVCNEKHYSNSVGSSLHASLHIVSEYDDRYLFNMDYVSGSTSFVVANESDGDYLNVKLKINKDPLGFVFETYINKEYNDLLDYLGETYGMVGIGADSINANDINYQLVLRNSDSIIIGPTFNIGNTLGMPGKISKLIKWSDIPGENSDDATKLFKLFFKNWNAYTEGWSIIGSLIITKDDYEVLSFVTNQIPVTQDIFAIYTDIECTYIDPTTINRINYEVVNKNKTIEYELNHPIIKSNEYSSDDEKIILRHNNNRTLKSYKTVMQQVICNKYN